MLAFVRDRLIVVGLVGGIIASLLIAVDPSTAHAATVNIIYRFQGGTDGTTPLGDLVERNGSVYFHRRCRWGFSHRRRDDRKTWSPIRDNKRRRWCKLGNSL
jgi:hypothetical protein